MNIFEALVLVGAALALAHYLGYWNGRRHGRRQGLMRGRAEASHMVSEMIHEGLLLLPPQIAEMMKFPAPSGKKEVTH